MNWRYAIGVTTIVGVLGVTTYSIYLYKKQQKQDRESISVEEAIAMTKEAKEETTYDIPYEELHIDLRENTNYKVAIDDIPYEDEFDNKIALTEEEVKTQERLMEEERIREELEIEKELEALNEPDELSMYNKGDRELRYEPNSDDALTQFKRMELAEWLPDHFTYEALMKLYDIPFVPTNDGDNNLFDTLAHYREEFFGDSKWNNEISFADLVLHYARRMDFNLGDGYKFWATEILAKTELDEDIYEFEHLEEMVSIISSHEYYDKDWDGWGLFCLDPDQWNEVLDIAEKSIDGNITFDMEFNVFLKTWN